MISFVIKKGMVYITIQLSGVYSFIGSVSEQNEKDGQYGDRTRDIRVISTTL